MECGFSRLGEKRPSAITPQRPTATVVWDDLSQHTSLRIVSLKSLVRMMTMWVQHWPEEEYIHDDEVEPDGNVLIDLLLVP